MEVVQVIPSVLVFAVALPSAVARNLPPPKDNAVHDSEFPNVRAVQVIPSVLVAAVFDGPVAIETKVLAPYAVALHLALDGIDVEVQLVPLVEYAALDELNAGDTKVPFPYALEYQREDDGNVRAVQVMPSVELAAAVFESLVAMYRFDPEAATLIHSADDGSVLFVQVMPSGLVAAVVPKVLDMATN